MGRRWRSSSGIAGGRTWPPARRARGARRIPRGDSRSTVAARVGPRLGAFAAVALFVLGMNRSPVQAAEQPGREPFAGIALTYYWGVECPHCRDAKGFVQGLDARYPGLAVQRVEVQRNASGRRRFLDHMTELGVSGAGVPAFVVGARAIIGFTPGRTEAAVHEAIAAAGSAAKGGPEPAVLDLPLFGRIDPRALSFPALTVAIGLADGLNPCAFWVLTVMLSLLLHVRSRLRLALFGGVFVLMSGVVYFLFMTVWTTMFALAGMAPWLTRLLGAALLAMGAVNLKELVWFKRGPSLMIPDRAKPGLYGRMRAIAGATSLPAAVLGIAALAFVVNLIELGCTIGLPAVYTRMLSLRPGVGAAGRYAFLALYNLAYVVPLGLVVAVYAVTFHRLALTERGAKVLKTVSGLLLTGFGLLFLARPEVLG